MSCQRFNNLFNLSMNLFITFRHGNFYRKIIFIVQVCIEKLF